MRKVLISILLAGAAASPAFAAQDRDTEHHPQWSDREGSHPARQQLREDRGQAREQFGAEHHDPQPQSPQSPQFEASRADSDGTAEARQRGSGVSRWTRDNVQQPGETSRWTRDPMQHASETGRWTRDRVGVATAGDLRQHQIEQQQQLGQSSHRLSGGWNHDWRNDRRHDWRRYRDGRRSIFRLGIYYDPFGYRYRPFNIGYRLQPLYYGQQYRFDPAMYGLPYPPPGMQWIRYWNDALLVDVYSGEVVDVIHNFFW